MTCVCIYVLCFTSDWLWLYDWYFDWALWRRLTCVTSWQCLDFKISFAASGPMIQNQFFNMNSCWIQSVIINQPLHSRTVWTRVRKKAKFSTRFYDCFAQFSISQTNVWLYMLWEGIYFRFILHKRMLSHRCLRWYFFFSFSIVIMNWQTDRMHEREHSRSVCSTKVSHLHLFKQSSWESNFKFRSTKGISTFVRWHMVALTDWHLHILHFALCRHESIRHCRFIFVSVSTHISIVPCTLLWADRERERKRERITVNKSFMHYFVTIHCQ